MDWWVRYPGRFKEERAKLKALGFTLTQPTSGEFACARGTIQTAGISHRLTLRYAPATPFVHGELFTDPGETTLPKHQNPYGRNLCTWADATRTWEPANHFGADLIVTARILYEATAEGRVDEVEEQAPHIASAYYRYAPGSCVIVPESMADVPRGTYGKFFLLVRGNPPVRALLKMIHIYHPQGGPEIRKAPGRLISSFEGSAEVVGVWRAVDDAPGYHIEHYEERDSSQVARAIKESLTLQTLPLTGGSSVGGTALQLDAWGVNFPDELYQYGEQRRTWLVGVEFNGQVISDTGLRTSARGNVMLRPQNVGLEEARLRTPTLQGLEEKSVGIVGLGAVGSPIAEQLARACIGSLFLVEYDTFDSGNIVRHAADMRHLGRNKGLAMADRIAEISPNTRVDTATSRFGGVLANTTADEASVTSQLTGCDVIVSAVADHNLGLYINRIAVAAGKPVILPWAVPGGWGGVVLQHIPGKTACLECWMTYMAAADAGGDPIDYPVEDDDGTLVFRGCSAPSFTGTGFDLLQVSLVATRVIVQTALAGHNGAYPASQASYYVIQNRTANDGSPQIRTHYLQPDSACRTCS